MSQEKSPQKSLITGITWVIAALTVIGLVLLIGNEYSAFTIIAFVILMLWINIFIGYFVWATYFYNINFGVSRKVWTKIEAAKDAKAVGKLYDADILEDEPLFNPYNDQTFGLPPGTVRGMIAFSLLFGGTALLIVSFGLDSEISPSGIFRDQFEFFKTAFLMMVAFYFGSKSLKYIQGEKPVEQYNTVHAQKKGSPSTYKANAGNNSPQLPIISPTDNDTNFSVPAQPTGTHVVVIDSSDPLGQKNMVAGSNPPIVGFDPMAQ